MKPRPRLNHRTPHRRGAIFIVALGITLILGSMVLVFAQRMRVEALASANRLSYAQADAIEQGAERWVQAQVDSYPGDALTITQVPAEAVQVGDGYFWILHPDPNSDQNYATGITDEAGKINLNTPRLTDTQLEALPGMTSSMADSILSWTGNPAGIDGASSEYYESLSDPYDAKNGAFETVDELLLIKDITPDVLYGQDLNHDGVVTDAERARASAVTTTSSPFGSTSSGGASSGLSSLFNNTSRGFYNDVTVYSFESATGRVILNTASQSSALNKLFTTAFGGSRAGQLTTAWTNLLRPPRGRAYRFVSLGDFCTRLGLQPADFGKIADKVLLNSAAGGKLTGLVNVNSASKEVLMGLGMQDSDAASVVSAQQSNVNAGTTSVAWAFTAAPTAMMAVAPFITGTSKQYSADIVAVANDGRSFKRVKIVVDGSTTPSTIVYRKDLTSLGWPLPDEIRKAMCPGQAPPTGIMSSTLGNAMGQMAH